MKAHYRALTKNDDNIKIIEVMIDKEQVFEPRVSATKLPNGKMVSSPLEEMSPYCQKRFLLIIPIAKIQIIEMTKKILIIGGTEILVKLSQRNFLLKILIH